MTRKQALDFLELSEDAVVFQIKQRIQEKLIYYEDLSRNAPSDFLRKLNAIHFSKVKEIKHLFPEWDPEKLESSIELPMDEADALFMQAEIAAGDLTIPVILSSAEKRNLGLSTPRLPDPPGWLIRHTENKSTKTFPLLVGKNYLGRKADPLLNPFIVIDEDTYVSKIQAVFSVELIKDQYHFFIADSAADNGGRASSNGTFVNGNTQRLNGRVELQDNDTIQLGLTKMVLRINNTSVKEAEQAVKKSKFMHTIVLNGHK